MNTDLSALYLDVIKDRLYTFAPNAPARRSAQTALWRIAEALTRLIAPILSFTADEVWPLLPHVEGRQGSVHLALFPDIAEIIPGDTSDLLEDWNELLATRTAVLADLELLRADKKIGKALEAHVVLKPVERYSDLSRSDRLAKYQPRLAEFFGVSSVVVQPPAFVVEGTASIPSMSIDVTPSINPQCERCWRYVPDVAANPDFPTVCFRCAEALTAIHYPPYGPSSQEAAD